MAAGADRDERLRFFIGDVRDRERLERATRRGRRRHPRRGAEAGARLRVQPVRGGQDQRHRRGERHRRRRSTTTCRRCSRSPPTRRSNPINLYGATKLVRRQAVRRRPTPTRASAGRASRSVRYGNVVGSRGSVIPFFLRQAADAASCTITDERMTRFWITLEQGVDFVLSSLDLMHGGEIFVPKIPSHEASSISPRRSRPSAEHRIVGIRPGEKLHEVMMTEDESRHSRDLDDCYVIDPEFRFRQPRKPLDRRAGRRRLPLLERREHRVADRRRPARGAPHAPAGGVTDFLPYGRQDITDEDVAAVADALRRPLITQGPLVEEFEAAFAEAVGARHAIAFANGTGALHAAAAAAGLGPGDEMLTTPVSFVASSNCALFVGARPRFSDIDATGNIDLAGGGRGRLRRRRAGVRRRLARRTAGRSGPAAGRPRGAGLVTIEDGCHALGRPAQRRADRRRRRRRHDDVQPPSRQVDDHRRRRDGHDEPRRPRDSAARVPHARDPAPRGRGRRRRPARPVALRRGDPRLQLPADRLPVRARALAAASACRPSSRGATASRRATANCSATSRASRCRPSRSGDDVHGYHLFVVRFPEGAYRRRQVALGLREAGIGTQLHYIPIYRHGVYRDRGYTGEEEPPPRVGALLPRGAARFRCSRRCGTATWSASSAS